MRILHLVHRSAPFHGGAERYVTEHASAAERWGHSSTIATTDAWDMTWLARRRGRRIEQLREVRGGVEIIRFRVVHPPADAVLRAVLRRIMPGGPDRFFHPNPFIPALYRWLSRDRGFGFVHSNAMPFLLYAGWRHAARFGAGHAAVPHANVGERFGRTDSIRYFDGAQPEVLRTSSFTVAQSAFERGLLLEMGVAPERIHLSGSGIDPDEFKGADPAAGRARHGLAGPVVLSLTAHGPDRGTGHLIAACRMLWESGRRFTLVLAGPVEPGFEPELARISAGLDGRLVLTGYVPRELRADLISAADVVALPSRLDCFGIIVLEAWACGRPVLGCWSGGMADIVRDGVDGYLCGFGDRVTLADRMARLLADPAAASAMGVSGRCKVLAEHTWEKVTRRFYMRLAECGP